MIHKILGYGYDIFRAYLGFFSEYALLLKLSLSGVDRTEGQEERPIRIHSNPTLFWGEPLPGSLVGGRT